MYLDTSAYLCILLGEDGADDLTSETADAELMSSVLLVLESRRNLIRLARDGALSRERYARCMAQLESDMDLFAFRELTLDLCMSNLLPPVSTPRSLDLAHLGTALWFHNLEPLDRFITMDSSQSAAAKELGLPV